MYIYRMYIKCVCVCMCICSTHTQACAVMWNKKRNEGSLQVSKQPLLGNCVGLSNVWQGLTCVLLKFVLTRFLSVSYFGSAERRGGEVSIAASYARGLGFCCFRRGLSSWRNGFWLSRVSLQANIGCTFSPFLVRCSLIIL
jgi:hypothetical protein